MNKNLWTISDAKSKLSELIKESEHTPQYITYRGNKKSVVVSYELWEQRLNRQSKLGTFLSDAPISDKDIKIDRFNDELRETGF